MASDLKKYQRMSFTTGGLFVNECITLAQEYLTSKNWNEILKWANSINLFQFRTQASSVRTIRECITRLQNLSDKEIRMLVDGNPRDQIDLVWLSVCRTYDFIADFTTEEISRRYEQFSRELQKEDLRFYFEKKAEWHDHLNGIKPNTKEKLVQVSMRLLREASILSQDNVIIGSLVSPNLRLWLSENNPAELKYFPGAI